MISALLLLAAGLPEIVEQTPAGAAKVLRPGTRGNQVQTASMSRGPWVDANGWRYRRAAGPKFVYEGVPANRLALAAAEAFAYGAPAFIRTDAAGREALKPMLDFLAALEPVSLPVVSDLFVVDDGSPVTAEVLTLLNRRNLLFDAGPARKPGYALTVEIGTPEFPRAQAANPSDFAYLVRKKLGDDNRSVRVYGSETVLAHFTSDGKRARLHLLNYGTDPVEAFRVRVKGAWKTAKIRSFQDGAVPPEEMEQADGGLEFGIPKLTTYAIVDLNP